MKAEDRQEAINTALEIARIACNTGRWGRSYIIDALDISDEEADRVFGLIERIQAGEE